MCEWLSVARRGLTMWTHRQWMTAALAFVGTALLIGIPTVLIPNPVFGREIPPVWWNYPVWLLTSLFAGMLVATYVRTAPKTDEASEKRTSRAGMVGAVLAWFAVGCPVCNKLALLVVGYTGAITWFAPMQPILAVVALVLTVLTLLVRLRGQVQCSVAPTRAYTA